MTEKLSFELALYPDPILRRTAGPVEAFDEQLGATIEGMYECMRASGGVGLAGPQVGLRKRLLVINPTGESGDALTLINPTIVELSGPSVLAEEGCLSFPGIYAEVTRPERCLVEAFDVGGKPIRGEHEGFVSRIIQHEYDHLEGVLLVDRMSPADKNLHRVALEQLVEDFKHSQAGG